MIEIRIPDLIVKKRDGLSLDKEEIETFVKGVVDGTVTDAQTGAMLMSMFLNGLNVPETVSLTECMKMSGDTLSWPKEWKGLVVDKHSTGGVGDKVSLPLAPALAACGLKVPMISGRGLGHTGGTLDKLESIPGFQVSFSCAQIRSNLEKVGACIVGQTQSLVPADKILYATRDTTGTVENASLITASIMSKKAAENLDALVLEITFGKAAGMKKIEDARNLGKALITLGNGLNIKTSAMFTRMDDPIGKMIGNALEIVESIECLKGKGPSDLREVITKLGGQLLYDTGKAKSMEAGTEIIKTKLDDGSAKEKFIEMMTAQGVAKEDARALFKDEADVFSILPKAKYTTQLKAPKSGYVHSIDALVLGVFANQLGAGRTQPGERINYAVGVQLHVQRGDHINKDIPWVTIHHDCTVLPLEKIAHVEAAICIEAHAPHTQDKIVEIMTD